jgi:hypothetical protein
MRSARSVARFQEFVKVRCDPGSSLRTQLDAHVANPVCAAGHNLMDPIGFGLEHFDAVGAWRDRDGTAAIDATGVLPDMTAFDGAVQLASALKHRSVPGKEQGPHR